MRKLRTGILGCGRIAHQHARAAIVLADQVELVAFCSREESQARAFAAQYTAGQGSVFTDYHAMFEQSNLDLVIICLPPFAHRDNDITAFNKRILLPILSSFRETSLFRVGRTNM